MHFIWSSGPCRRRDAVFIAILLLCLAAGSAAGDAAYRTMLDQVELDRIGIRFAPETQTRVRSGDLVSLSGADLSRVAAIAAAVPGAQWQPRFGRPEAELDRLRLRGEARTRQALPDLNLFGLLVLPPVADAAAGRERMGALLAELNAIPEVAEAWALPIPVPASIQDPDPPARDRTPDFAPLQGYLYDSPAGIWADSAWTFPGGLGQGVKIIALEWGWLWTHEDLKDPFYTAYPQGPSDHGTAAVGEFAGQHNGYGINGISPEVEIGGIHLGDLASGILEAIAALSPGDLYNMSIQVSGPQGWMPVEWYPDCFAVIQTGTALGVMCLEAAGNGTVDLDDPLYDNYFDRRVHDSGAIMVGAGTPQGLDAEWFSNHGDRVSLQGWGSSVTTTGYGDLQGGDPTVHYTAGFSGTSSATPMVAGAIASLQGQALALFGEPLTPALAEEMLSVTGSPYSGGKPIGQRPNLAAARERLVRGYGDVLVTVRDGATLAPLPEMIVSLPETGRFHMTGPDGRVALQLTAGLLTFRVSGDFFYTEDEFPFEVEAGGQQEVTLDIFLRPVGALAGRVTDGRGDPLADVRVHLLAAPTDTCWSAGDGLYSLESIPEDSVYTAIASRVPTKGAASARIGVSGGQTTAWNPVLVDAETFESGGGGFTPAGGFVRGHATWPSGYDRVPFSGQNVWSTSLTTYYPALTTMTLTSPVYDLSEATSLTLSFHHWYWIESDDGGQVEVWDASLNRWETVYPVGGYPDDNIIILIYEPGYNGRQTSWEPAVFHLDEWAGQDFRFRFLFKSNYSGQKIGWDIDDVALDTGQYPASVVDPAAFTTRISFAQGGPNPTLDRTRIAFHLNAPGETRLELFDVRGALVRAITAGRLEAGPHEIVWNGRDARGRPVSGGMVLYRLISGGEQVSGRLVKVQ